MTIPPAQPEASPSGAPILKHQAREREFELAAGDSPAIERISDHITRNIGQPSGVFHEFVSDLVHLDVHIVDLPPRARPVAGVGRVRRVVEGHSNALSGIRRQVDLPGASKLLPFQPPAPPIGYLILQARGSWKASPATLGCGDHSVGHPPLGLAAPRSDWAPIAPNREQVREAYFTSAILRTDWNSPARSS